MSRNAFYGSGGRNVTNSTNSNISVTIDKGAEVIEETILPTTFSMSIPSGTSSP